MVLYLLLKNNKISLIFSIILLIESHFIIYDLIGNFDFFSYNFYD